MSRTTPTLRRCNGPFTKALVIEHPDPSLDGYLEAMGISVDRLQEVPDEDELVRVLQQGQHQLIFKRSRVPITERVVTASAQLAGVMLCCIGHDSVDKQACARHGVLVTHDPVSNGRSVAEMVIGELIVLSRRIFDSVIEMSESVWQKNNLGRYEVQGKKLGLVGLGNIGRQVAQLATALGMEIAFFDTSEISHEVGMAMGYAAVESLDELFTWSDFVSMHVSADDVHGNSNEHLITSRHLELMAHKDYESPRIFLNLARGIVIQPEQLRASIEAGHIHYAITDVFPDEPRASGDHGWVSPYQGEPRIFATPHIGAATREAQPRIAKYVAKTTQLLSHFGMVRNCVYSPRTKVQFHHPAAKSVLAVVHADTRGTKKAVDDAIYNAGANNLRSMHVDFSQFGIAYDLSALDRTLSAAQCDELVSYAQRLTGDAHAIRYIRRIPLSEV